MHLPHQQGRYQTSAWAALNESSESLSFQLLRVVSQARTEAGVRGARNGHIQ